MVTSGYVPLPTKSQQQLANRRAASDRQREYRESAKKFENASEIVRSFDLSTQSNFGPFNAQVVNGIITSHNQGTFNMSGRFADVVFTDERVHTALETRISMLLDLWEPSTVQLSGGNPAALEWWNKNLFRIVSRRDLYSIQVDRFMMNFSLAQLCYEGEWWNTGPRLVRWHPSLVQYYHQNRCFAAITLDDGIEFIESNAKWHVFSNMSPETGYYYSWRDAGVCQLADAFMRKKFALRDWSRFSEVYGMCLKLLRYPCDASEQEKVVFLNKLNNLTTEQTIPLLTDSEGKKLWDIELLQPGNDSPEAMHELINESNKQIDISILGTTQIIDGPPGPYGSLTSKWRGMVLSKPRLDCMFLEADINALVKNVTAAVFGDEYEAPCVKIDRDTIMDTTQLAGKNP